MPRRGDRHLDDAALLAFQLDQLARGRVLAVATHLQACTRCAQRLEALAAGLEAADELTGDHEDEAELDPAPPRRPGLRPWYGGLGLLSGCGALALLSLLSPAAAPAGALIGLAAVVTVSLVLVSVGSAQRLIASGEQVFRRRYLQSATATQGAGLSGAASPPPMIRSRSCRRRRGIACGAAPRRDRP